MGPKKSILIVDSDAKSLRVLEVSLRRAGFTVNTAPNAAEALQGALQQPPDLLITDSHLPDDDGFSLASKIRSEASTAHTAILFLSAESSPEMKIRGINAGADDFLTKPVLVKEIVSRIRGLLERKAEDSITRRERPGNLSGTLANMGVVDLLQVMDAGKKSGVVHISSDVARSGGFISKGEERGTLYFRDGQVVDAKLGNLDGAEAVYRSLLWEDGVFEIEFTQISRPDVVHTPTQTLLLEGMRRVDEWSRLVEKLPPLNARLSLDYAAIGRQFPSVPAEVKAVIHLFDGRRTLFEVINDSSVDDRSALNIIAKLHQEAVLVNEEEEDSSSVEAWLNASDEDEDVGELPSALGQAVIPSPQSPSELLSAETPDEVAKSTSEVPEQVQAVQETVAPEPVATAEEPPVPTPEPIQEEETIAPTPSRESSIVLSRHTVPANRAVPLTRTSQEAAQSPIPLTEPSRAPKLNIQRVSSIVSAAALPAVDTPKAGEDPTLKVDERREPTLQIRKPEPEPASIESTGSDIVGPPTAQLQQTPEPAIQSALSNDPPPALAVAGTGDLPSFEAHSPAPSNGHSLSNGGAGLAEVSVPEGAIPSEGPALIITGTQSTAPAELPKDEAPTRLPTANGAEVSVARVQALDSVPPTSEAPTLQSEVPQAAKPAPQKAAPAAAPAAEVDDFFNKPAANEDGGEIDWGPDERSAVEKFMPYIFGLGVIGTLAFFLSLGGNHEEGDHKKKDKQEQVAKASGTNMPTSPKEEIKIEEAKAPAAAAAAVAPANLGAAAQPGQPAPAEAAAKAEVPKEVAKAATTEPAKPAAAPTPAAAVAKAPAPAKPTPAAKAEAPKKPKPAPKAVNKAAYDQAINQGERALASENFRSASQKFREAIKANNGSAKAHSGLAFALLNQEKDRSARAEAWKALKLSSREGRAHLVLGVVADNNEKPAKARKHYQRFLRLAPKHPMASEIRSILAQPQ